MNRLKELRENCHLNMREMAKELNIPYTTYVNYEKSEREPNSEMLITLADYFKVTVDYIIGRESPCHVCGLFFTNTPNDKKEHEMIHAKCLKAIEKYGFFWEGTKRELIKQDSWNVLDDVNSSKLDKLSAAENICKSYFSRSLWASGFDLIHPTFNDYTAMLLHQEHFQKRFSDVYSELKNKYGTRIGITEGKTIWQNYTQENEQEDDIFQHDNIFPIKTHKIPLLGEIACGEPIFAVEDRESYVIVETDIKADFCLKAKGDSMINARIYDGDIVFIRSQPTVDNGNIAAVIIDNEATLKRVYYYPAENRIVLMPENPAYSPLVYCDDELNTIRILGKAIAFQSDVF